MNHKRLLSLTAAALLAVQLPLTVIAEEYDLAQGSVTIHATEGGQTVTHGTNGAVNDNAPVIKQTGTDATKNTVTITAEAGATANVTLGGGEYRYFQF